MTGPACYLCIEMPAHCCDKLFLGGIRANIIQLMYPPVPLQGYRIQLIEINSLRQTQHVIWRKKGGIPDMLQAGECVPVVCYTMCR